MPICSVPEYTFCQERDTFNGVQCCSGTDGDPSSSNLCREGKDTQCSNDAARTACQWLQDVATIVVSLIEGELFGDI